MHHDAYVHSSDTWNIQCTYFLAPFLE